jgi:hypothetical protein
MAINSVMYAYIDRKKNFHSVTTHLFRAIDSRDKDILQSDLAEEVKALKQVLKVS